MFTSRSPIFSLAAQEMIFSVKCAQLDNKLFAASGCSTEKSWEIYMGMSQMIQLLIFVE